MHLNVATICTAYWASPAEKSPACGRHPDESSGSALHHSVGRYVVLSLCIGVGHGIAVVIERV